MPSAWVTRSRSPLVPSTTRLGAAQLAQLREQHERQEQRDERHPPGGQRGDAGGRCEVVGHGGRIAGTGAAERRKPVALPRLIP